MTFSKDILLIDFETTHINPDLAEPLQLSAILLDKNTLLEKESFSTYIKTDLSHALPEALTVNGITEVHMQDAPELAEAAQSFVDKFGYDVLLSSWVEFLDRRMLEKTMKKAGMQWPAYDYHYLDIWPIAYLYLLKNGYTGTIKSEAMFQAFNLPSRTTHDALEDCRLAAAILRKIMSV